MPSLAARIRKNQAQIAKIDAESRRIVRECTAIQESMKELTTLQLQAVLDKIPDFSRFDCEDQGRLSKSIDTYFPPSFLKHFPIKEDALEQRPHRFYLSALFELKLVLSKSIKELSKGKTVFHIKRGYDIPWDTREYTSYLLYRLGIAATFEYALRREIIVNRGWWYGYQEDRLIRTDRPARWSINFDRLSALPLERRRTFKELSRSARNRKLQPDFLETFAQYLNGGLEEKGRGRLRRSGRTRMQGISGARVL